MVQTTQETVSAPSAPQTLKQRKKQAKRKAKAIFAVEQAQAKVQKAEQQVTKARQRLEARVAGLHKLEEKQAATTQQTAEQS